MHGGVVVEQDLNPVFRKGKQAPAGDDAYESGRLPWFALLLAWRRRLTRCPHRPQVRLRACRRARRRRSRPVRRRARHHPRRGRPRPRPGRRLPCRWCSGISRVVRDGDDAGHAGCVGGDGCRRRLTDPVVPHRRTPRMGRCGVTDNLSIDHGWLNKIADRHGADVFGCPVLTTRSRRGSSPRTR